LKVRAISLLSGGLDSILAVRLIQDQDIEVTGVSFVTPFFDAERATGAARELGVPLVVVDFTEAHLSMLKKPRYGYGKNMNPCIDCHALMLREAGRKMEEMKGDFLFTGEVLGQRPMSQTKQSLHIVAKLSGYEDIILRPLSAKLLPETRPEREGKVDRSRLLDIQGRGRKRQIALAASYGITSYANPAGGCLLTDSGFSRKLRDLFDHTGDFPVRDVELLKVGRHFRLSPGAKIIVGRNQGENRVIQDLSREEDMIFRMQHVPGPLVLLVGKPDEESIRLAAAICARYSDAPPGEPAAVRCQAGPAVQSLTVVPADPSVVEEKLI